MSRLFGTDGVRGVANKELTPELAMKIGRAGALVLSKHLDKKSKKPVIVVGMDTRISSQMLACALMAGITSVGADVIFTGVVPTPAVAYFMKKYHPQGGVVISASHNPVEFNGIKFFDGDGYKLEDAVEDEIASLVTDGLGDMELPTGTDLGRIIYRTEGRDEYSDSARASQDIDLAGFKIVCDCAEGASHITSVNALRASGAEVIAIHNSPDGTNINKNCGSTHMEELKERVLVEKAQVGLAFDGDADRLLAVDEQGNTVDGDQIMAIVGNYLKDRGKLHDDTIVVTVMTNLGFHLMAREKGIKVEVTDVGDRYVLERMKEISATLGGEQSGHLIFLEENTTGDGLLSAMHLLKVMADTGKPLSELASVMTVLPQYLCNAAVTNENKNRYTDYPEIVKAIEELEARFDGEGRVLIRPSGTEPLVRVMIEGKDESVIKEEADRLKILIEKIMG